MSLKIIYTEENGTVKELTGEVGQTVMEVGREAGVEGILADCGGCCACATCHVYVDEAWMEKVGGPDAVETEILDLVGDIARPNSRLSCQIRLKPELDGLRVTVKPMA